MLLSRSSSSIASLLLPKVLVDLDVAKLEAVATTVHVYFLAEHSKVVGCKCIIVVGNLQWFLVPLVASDR